jgi:hypothetical protein
MQCGPLVNQHFGGIHLQDARTSQAKLGFMLGLYSTLKMGTRSFKMTADFQ